MENYNDNDITITGGSCVFREFANNNEFICMGVNSFGRCPLLRFLEVKGMETRVKLEMAVPCQKVMAEIIRRGPWLGGQ